MARKRLYRSKKKLGQIPGTVVYTGERSKEKLSLEAFDFDKDSFTEKQLATIEDCFDYKNTNTVSWVNLNGLNHVEAIENLGKHYDIHHLVLEDIVNIAQRPKVDDHQTYLFVVLKMLYYNNNNQLVSEQVSFILGKNYVFTFQEAEGDVFDPIRDRIRNAKGRIRNMQADYLLYTLIDAIVDHYFSIIEILGDKIEDLETDVFTNKTSDDLSIQIQDLKREVLRVRRAVFPLRDIINKIEKNDTALINSKTIHYFKDVYDHLTQVSENIELHREVIGGLMGMYLTSISNKMNEVMKVLTIMASIFIPLTFIAGVYGMNFAYIPELQYKYAYFVFWGVMVVLFLILLYYFKRKKWL
ncbi:magnesium/cobalt transporter CorA [Seonamhaeicola algicola]|uniref:Magnesium transport protein CorA n=1 Tax=Seonamhaeicola algicola TaxID=1719036 RepID=A0A5C7B567_9FLAO|nr:magnesium/cobalt transporter CorA [Seonamhaeicola algicola]TXE14939.1 magnesium/cobalt transporter CorA [Seonamhaeicola algicola]